MTQPDNIKYLRIALVVAGLIFILGIWPLTIVWPSGWSWHRSLIGFTVSSSAVHGAVMAVQSVTNPQHIGHLWGDVAVLIAVAAVLGLLTSRTTSTRIRSAA